MQVLLEVGRGPQGAIVGTARWVGGGEDSVPFHGVLELVSIVDRAADGDPKLSGRHA